mgnify:CR=1 FL=1
MTTADLQLLKTQLVRMVFTFPDHSIIAVKTTLNKKILMKEFGRADIDGIVDFDFKVIVPEYLFKESIVSIDLELDEESFYKNHRLIDITIERGLKNSWTKI